MAMPILPASAATPSDAKHTRCTHAPPHHSSFLHHHTTLLSSFLHHPNPRAAARHGRRCQQEVQVNHIPPSRLSSTTPLIHLRFEGLHGPCYSQASYGFPGIAGKPTNTTKFPYDSTHFVPALKRLISLILRTAGKRGTAIRCRVHREPNMINVVSPPLVISLPFTN
jgi:hypothetical protein